MSCKINHSLAEQQQLRGCSSLSPETQQAALKILEKYYLRKTFHSHLPDVKNPCYDKFRDDHSKSKDNILNKLPDKSEENIKTFVGNESEKYENSSGKHEYCSISMVTGSCSISISSFDSNKNQTRLWNSIRSYGFSHVTVLVVALICYILLGSWIFQRLEGNAAVERLQKFSQLSHGRHVRYYHAFRNLLRNKECLIGHSNPHPTPSTNISRENLLRCNNHIRILLEKYDEEIFLLADLPLKSWINHTSQGDEFSHTKSDWHWNYWNSAFFALSIITTIGYGNMSCETTEGRVVTILYAIVGIPLMLVMLNKLGGLLFHYFQSLYNRIRTIFLSMSRLIKKDLSIDHCDTMKTPKPQNDYVASKCYQEKDNFTETFPLYLALLIVFAYISLCALLLSVFEEHWDWFTAFYFLFISLSTIGLGDEMPEYSHYYTTYSFVFLLVGLALVSMCISVMKIRVENHYMAALELLDENNRQIYLFPQPTNNTMEKNHNL